MPDLGQNCLEKLSADDKSTLVRNELKLARGYKTFSCSTQLSTKFQLLIKTKMKMFLAFSLSDVVIIMLINVKIATIVGILTFMSRINFVLN